MTNLQNIPLPIFTGIILLKNKIAGHTYHIKVQSRDFPRIQYVAGLVIEIYQTNPYYDHQSNVRRYAFWDYEPIHSVADFAITISSDQEDRKWIEALQEGDILFFRSLPEPIIKDYSGDHYFLIGDIRGLSALYEFNRALPVSKTVTSLVLIEDEEDFFADVDHSFPLNSYNIKSIHSAKILEYIQKYFPKNKRNTIAYIFCDSGCFIADYLKGTPVFGIREVYVNSL
ncbi:hypothetical protein C1631_002940 [Chryseobacterium phosphatilyticum]|uniref:FAD-binding FR-type domain-containing protein n=1 Tax=Chryseobacterium phosphatilyticum TaxID=475075 RepID=A0A316XFT8_9FLAO|nr:hypothetical protein [Chryseobacterium phosphatilyticum]PWN71596.1 hypothetical protein C1631_002940 [Chryseobacterium phosphatilyticum]